MRPCPVEEGHIFFDHPIQLPISQN
jgi:hypothetical protein